jgi:hypothetical protein
LHSSLSSEEEHNTAATGDTTARRLPPRCVRSSGSSAISPSLPSAATPRATRGRPLLMPPTSAAGSPRRPPPQPPPLLRAERRARGGLWATCLAWQSRWSAPPTPPSLYIAASARPQDTVAPSNAARSGFHPPSSYSSTILF